MKKICLLVCLFWMYTYAWAGNPVLLSPQDRSHVNLEKSLSVSAYANDARATRMSISLLRNSPRKVIYRTTTDLLPGHSVAQPATVQLLTTQAYATTEAWNSTQPLAPMETVQYLIELATFDAAGEMIGQTYATVFDPPRSPLLVSPDTKLVYNLHGNKMTFDVQVNDARTQQCQVELVAKKTGNEVSLTSAGKLRTSTIVNGKAKLEARVGVIESGDYWLVVTTLGDSPTAIYGCSVQTLSINYRAPVLVAPLHHATIDIPTSKVLNVSVRHTTPGPGNLYIKVFRNDPRELLVRQVVPVSAGFYQDGQLISTLLSIPQLEPNEQYLLELSDGTDNFLAYSTFFTRSADPESAPRILHPVPEKAWSIAEFTRPYEAGWARATIQPNNPKARFIRIRVLDSNGNRVNYDNPFLSGFHQDHTITVDPALGTTVVPTGLSFRNPADKVSVEVTTMDANRHVLSQAVVSDIETIGCSWRKDPHIPVPVYPTPGQGDVSVQPALHARSPNSDDRYFCGTADIKQYEIDAFPADWTGIDYQTTTSISTPWTPVNPLKPNTTYEWRISYTNFGKPWGGNILTHTVRFTTGSGAAASRMAVDLWTQPRSMVAPSPFDKEFSIRVSEVYPSAQVRVFSQDGRIVWQRQAKGDEQVYVPTTHLPTGLYTVHIQQPKTGQQEQFRIVKH